VGKIAEKAVCRSAFLITWHYNLSAKLTKTHFFLQPLQLLVMYPLQEMATIQYTDTRQQQFDCVLNILQERATQLGTTWPVMLRIIGSATNQQK